MSNDEQVEPGNEEEHQLIAVRRSKLEQWQQNHSPWPNHFRPEHSAQEIQTDYANSSREELAQKNISVSLAGRIVNDRNAFLVLQDVSGTIQLYIARKQLAKTLVQDIKDWDLGDIIAVEGCIRRSQRGDLYIELSHALLLAKALRPLPDKFHGLKDQELRYRQRYLDLLVNPDSRDVFTCRFQLLSELRRFFAAQNFIEVETPMMHSIPGGAHARPFVTHYNVQERELYLRIAPELYLKRLIVGGMEQVFEINRSFRNEGLSPRHNPEFTMLELYWAYRDYHDLMVLTEELLAELCKHLNDSNQLTYQGKTIDLTPPFTRLGLKEAVLQYNQKLTASDIDDVSALQVYAKKVAIEIMPEWGKGKLLLEIFEKTVEEHLTQPTFITEYPVEVSPLARSMDSNPEFSERFELFIAGREIANGFSELNDPQEQAKRFREQVKGRSAGDDEAMFYDDDYIRALEYGMPPTAGEGIGIDRLVMLFTDQPAIRDVILFPQLKD